MTLSILAQFLTSLILGFLFSNYFSSRFDDERVERTPFRFKLGTYRVNFHNWIWCLFLIFFCMYIHIYNPVVLGIIFGALIQGLTYKDRFVILYKAKDFEKIYSKFFQ